jgi:hypothetical protein
MNSGPAHHPSFLELDRGALGAMSEEQRRHLDACPTCSAYVARLQQPLPIPAWVREEAARSRPAAGMRSWLGALAALAAAASVLAVAFPAREPRVQVKGQASVALYLKRGEQISLWDGRSPVRPGDLLRLKVVPEEQEHVLVAAAAASGELKVLYQGAVAPRCEALLPESWRVDETAEPETLVIALSAKRLDVEALRRALASSARTPDLWTTVLTLHKAS